MTLTEMRQILSAGDIQLTRSLGQNFLHDGNQLRRIVAAGDVQAGENILEIGPGLGPLTELLLATGAEVLAIEKDQRLASFLNNRHGTNPHLRLLHEDALDYVRQHREWMDWKLVANLPYSVASPILVELAEAAHRPRRMTVTLQLEVANRIVASHEDDDYGVLSLLLQLRYEAGGIFKIPAACFFPSPDVDSACITLIRRESPLLPETQATAFTRLVKLAFSQRRKMMFKLLKQHWPVEKLAAAFEQTELSPQIRAEAVSLSQFVQLTQILAP